MEKYLLFVFRALEVVITFGLAVFVHEFGHMMFALLRGVGVESFAIGMGPKITSWKWRGIDFSLRWFPLGGFVKLQGRTPPPTEDAAATPAAGAETAEPADDKSLGESAYDDLYALQDKGFVTKVLVFGGGVFMNYVTAIVAITLVFLIGYKIDLFPIKIEKAEAGTPVAASGLKPGDLVVALNGKPVKYTEDLVDQVSQLLDQTTTKNNKTDAAKVPTIQLNLTVDRGGKQQELALEPMDKAGVVKFLDSVDASLWRPAYVETVLPNTEADKAGLQKGDLIVELDGKPVDSFSQVAAGINANANNKLEMKVKRAGQIVTLHVTPAPGLAATDQNPKLGYIGFAPGAPAKKIERISNPFRAVVQAQGKAYDQVKRIVMMNYKFFKNATMKDVQKNVTGPIGIAVITVKMAQMGIEDLVNWFILLNLLLMIFNLLPLPVLDGGFILLAIIEGIIRRPVPPKVLGPIYTVFVVGFIVLIVLISVQDLFNWVIPRLAH